MFIELFRCFSIECILQDAHTLDFGTLFDRNPNITTVRLVDPTTPEIEQAVGDWSMWEEHNSGQRLQITTKNVRVRKIYLNIYTAIHKL